MAKRFDFERLRSSPLYCPGTRQFDFSYSSGRWAEPIDRLLAAKYPFYPCRYSDQGFLFRGIPAGLAANPGGTAFGHFDSDHEMAVAEQVMDVFFVTHELSDAVTVSGIYEDAAQSGIFVFRAERFNEQLDAGKAAVLAIGDSGVIFRYPFLTAPLSLSEIDYLLVNLSFLETASIPPGFEGKLVVMENPPGQSRSDFEQRLGHRLDSLGITPAAPIPSSAYPRR